MINSGHHNEKNNKLQADPAHSPTVQGSDSGRAESETAKQTNKAET
jgi:hypothetical protein